LGTGSICSTKKTGVLKLKKEQLKEYIGAGNVKGGRTVSPSMDHPHIDKFYKIKSAVATFPYIHIDDIDDVDVVDLEDFEEIKDEDNEFPYPYSGYESGESFEDTVSIGAGGTAGSGIPSKAGGGGSNQDAPAGMNSPGWASAPRNTERARKEKDYIKDFLSKFSV